MLYLAVAIMVFTAIRLIVASANLLQRQWLQAATGIYHGKVSVLIPARNEESNIGRLLDGIIGQEYSNWEVLVYDDLSLDNTAGIVRAYEKAESRIRLVSGRQLPAGWTGKCHACHRLAMQATGDILLFIDADVLAGRRMIGDGLAHLRSNKLHLLSIFPTQVMKSIGEKISVPIMNWILVSLLSLKKTMTSPYASLSAANGQFMMFDAKTYKAYMFHSRFRESVAEDIDIARQMKRQKLRIHTLLDGGQVGCRMYTSLNQALNGFSRNIASYFGGSTLVTIAFTVITSIGFLPVYIALGHWWLAGYLSATLLLRAVVSVAARQNVGFNLISAPLQQSILVILTIRSVFNKFSGKIKWKGRVIKY